MRNLTTVLEGAGASLRDITIRARLASRADPVCDRTRSSDSTRSDADTVTCFTCAAMTWALHHLASCAC